MSSKIRIFKDTPYGENRLPFNITHGSLHPGDVLSRLGRCLEAKVKKGGPGAYVYQMRVVRGEVQTADQDRLFSRLVFSQQGSLQILKTEEGLEAYFLVETGETLHDEKLLGTIELAQVTQIDRLSERGDVNLSNPYRVSPPAGLAGAAVVTELIPTVAELCVIAGTAWTFLVEKRVRFGVKFKYAGEHTGELVCDIRQSGWFLIDSLWHPPYWNPK